MLPLLLLHILISIIGDNAADEHDGIEADAEARTLCVGSRGNGTGERSLGLRVASLEKKACVSNTKPILAETIGAGVLTLRFNVPTLSPSRVSRASSLWPTSSNASVAS